MNTIIFTDLDGTLIDRDTYSPELTAEKARQLVESGTPIVFCSSKTRVEQMALMTEMNLSIPCILENGSGLYLPPGLDLPFAGERSESETGGTVVALGTPSEFIRESIDEVSRAMKLDLRPYSKLSVDEVAEITGLDEVSAKNARTRDFSETLTARLPINVWNQISDEFEKRGLQCICGGRYYTVSSKDCSKGTALKAVVDAYRNARGGHWRSIGIGDSDNDYDMLAATDEAYLVQRTDGLWNAMDLPHLVRVSGIGPKGWLVAVESALALS